MEPLNKGLYPNPILRNLKNTTGLKTLLPWVIILTMTISIVFNFRLALNDSFAYFLGEKKDFIINFFYISDIFVICLLYPLYKLWNVRPATGQVFSLAHAPTIILFLAILSYIVNFNDLTIPNISIYYLLNIAKIYVLHETVKRLNWNFISLILRSMWFLGLFEAIIAILQFTRQGNLGFKWLGEPQFGPYVWGVAKVEALGQVFSRPYGTLAHPNVLSAILVVTLCLGLYYLYSRKAINWHNWIYILGIEITGIALFMSFSRAAWLATVVGVATFLIFTWNIVANKERRTSLQLLLVSIAVGGVLFSTYLPFVKQRGNLFDKAYNERITYNQAAILMIRSNPILGMGPGESVLHMEQYLGKKAEPWEVQPIHNYYLILAAEIGLPSAILCILYILILCQRRITSHKYKGILNIGTYLALLLSVLVSCLALMFFDHYFYTIQVTMLLLWCWLGIVANPAAPAEE